MDDAELALRRRPDVAAGHGQALCARLASAKAANDTKALHLSAVLLSRLPPDEWVAVWPVLRPVLDELGRGLDRDMRITVVGHTDSTGSDAINDPLSRDRAEAVRDYLSVRGVPRDRITVIGRGSREPVASNDNESSRSQNRRVEIFLSDAAA